MNKSSLTIIFIVFVITVSFAKNTDPKPLDPEDTIHRELPLEMIKQPILLPKRMWQTGGSIFINSYLNKTEFSQYTGSSFNFLARHSFTTRLEFSAFPLPFISYRISEYDICDSANKLTYKPSIVIGGGISQIMWNTNSGAIENESDAVYNMGISVKAKQLLSEKIWYFTSLFGQFNMILETYSLDFTAGLGRQSNTNRAATLALTLNYHDEGGLPVYTGGLPLNLINNINKSLGFGFFIDPRLDFRHTTSKTFSSENFRLRVTTGISLTCQW